MTEGITEPGNLRLELFLLLCLAWVIVYFCLWRGTVLSRIHERFVEVSGHVILRVLRFEVSV
jgi:hypothetical protein